MAVSGSSEACGALRAGRCSLEQRNARFRGKKGGRERPMGHLDVWTILTGAASIISLFITLSDRFPAWQRHIKSTGLILGGFAIGRITAGSIPPTSESIQDPRLIGLVMILITIFAMLYLFVR